MPSKPVDISTGFFFELEYKMIPYRFQTILEDIDTRYFLSPEWLVRACGLDACLESIEQGSVEYYICRSYLLNTRTIKEMANHYNYNPSSIRRIIEQGIGRSLSKHVAILHSWNLHLIPPDSHNLPQDYPGYSRN